jgi:hypothetical protein
MTKPGEQSSVADMLAHAPMMCDNDKYSMMFQFARMPETERQSAFTQMPNMPGEDMFRNDAPVDDAKLFKNNVNRWVKNYYRFFKLYRRKGDFFNPFDEVISPMDIDLLSENFDRKAVGNFMFKRKLYSKVYDLFNVFGLDEARLLRRKRRSPNGGVGALSPCRVIAARQPLDFAPHGSHI